MCCKTGGRFLAHVLNCFPLPPRLPTTGHQMICSWGKWPECKDDRSPRSRVDAKNARRRTPYMLPRCNSCRGTNSFFFIFYYDSHIFPSPITGKVSGLCRFRINSATRNSSVNIVTRLQAAQLRNCHATAGKFIRFSLLQNIQTNSEAHPAFYSIGNVGPFTRVKAVEA